MAQSAARSRRRGRVARGRAAWHWSCCSRLCLALETYASRLIANASTRQTPVVVQASTEAGEVPESPFVLDTSNPFAALMSPSPVKLASPSPAKKRTPAAPRRV